SRECTQSIAVVARALLSRRPRSREHTALTLQSAFGVQHSGSPKRSAEATPTHFLALSCVVCGSGERSVICSAAEVGRQRRDLREFQRRRLRPRSDQGDDHSLADPADFTHEYDTDIVECRRCGLVFRASRPATETAVAEYGGDEYGVERLRAVFE